MVFPWKLKPCFSSGRIDLERIELRQKIHDVMLERSGVLVGGALQALRQRLARYIPNFPGTTNGCEGC